MLRKILRFREVIKYIGIKSVIASVLVFLLTVAVTFAGGYQLYHYTKDSLLLQGEVNAIKSSKEFDRYLTIRKNAVILGGHVIDKMITEHQPNDVILKYMISESKSIKTSIDSSSTGLYGWINGEYLDGEGWVPDADYVPTERPWYTETIADDDEVTFVRPYLDEQTKTVMTTMATELIDNKSVLAYDVSLERIQEITQEIAEQSPGSYGIVLDKTGQVIAHSDRKQLGKNYWDERNTLGSELVKEIFNGDKKRFELSFDGKNYMIYTVEIEGGWKSISMINTAVFYRPLKIILVLLVLLSLLEATIFGAIFYNLSSKNLAISIQNIQLSAVADMYISIYDIDISDDNIREIRRGRDFERIHIISENHNSAQSALNEIFDKNVNELSKPVMDPFLDITTLPLRLATTDTITEEYLDSQKSWCRGRFVVADRDDEGTPVRALWMIESIDEEKKHRDNLKHLSETDRMTGLYNRTAGESKISEMLNRGIGGMLILLDVDKFKSINDGFGHDVGDKVIIAVAEAIAGAFRSSDIVMRLGGDEFMAYAPGVLTEEVGSVVARRIFNNIAGTEIPELGEYRFYVSVGAAFSQKDVPMSFADLYKQADTCTYESKKQTGNAITFYGE